MHKPQRLTPGTRDCETVIYSLESPGESGLIIYHGAQRDGEPDLFDRGVYLTNKELIRLQQAIRDHFAVTGETP